MAQKRTLLAGKPEYAWLAELGITENTPGVYNGKWTAGEGEEFTPISPFTGEPIASFRFASKEQYDSAVKAAHEAFKEWRNVPMPIRGDIVNEIGRELTANLDALRYILQFCADYCKLV